MVADDESVRITADAVKTDSEGDPGYVLHIANKTAGKVYVYSKPGWTAKGAATGDLVLRALVGAGEVSEEFAWFDKREFSTGSLDGLKGVEGIVVVEDYDTGAIVGEYAFKS